MKRSSIRRKARKPVDRNDPARIAWKEQRAGYCQCGCDRFSLHLEHHHVLTAERLRQEGREDVMWSPENGMYLDPVCHSRHTSAMRRIPVESVPEAAARFTVAVLGEGPAAEYFRRQYGCEQERRAA